MSSDNQQDGHGRRSGGQDHWTPYHSNYFSYSPGPVGELVQNIVSLVDMLVGNYAITSR